MYRDPLAGPIVTLQRPSELVIFVFSCWIGEEQWLMWGVVVARHNTGLSIEETVVESHLPAF